MWIIPLIVTFLCGCFLSFLTWQQLNRQLDFRVKLHRSIEKMADLGQCGPLELAGENLHQACRYLCRAFPGQTEKIRKETQIFAEAIRKQQIRHQCHSPTKWGLEVEILDEHSGDRHKDWPGYSFFYFRSENRS